MIQDRFVLLDRDGVINQDSDLFIKSSDEWLPIPGSLEAIALLNNHGYRVAVITNQSGVARGLFDTETLATIHDKMLIMTSAQGGNITDIYYCPHGPDDNCECRKPKPGLLHEFSQDHKIDLAGIFCIGDSFRDLQAAWAVDANPLLVKTGKGQRTLEENPNLDIPVFADLYAASQFIISQP
jgi:D-glycero-D-manno-heptose 1,7-bisphosphate phosphatase